MGEKVEGGDVQPPPPLSKKQNTHTHLSKTNLGVNYESAKQDTKTLFRTFPKLQEARLGKTNIIGWLGVKSPKLFSENTMECHMAYLTILSI